MIRVMHDEHAFSDRFLSHLLARSMRTQEDLVDQLFNSSEKRLARLLLLMSCRLRFFNDLQTRGERLKPPKSCKTSLFVDRIVDQDRT
jgi:CRP-like cAMP-binding protein